MADLSYGPKVYEQQGGDRLVVASGGSVDVESGGEIDVESGGALKIAGTALTGTAAELNKLAGVTAGTVTASKAVVVGANKNLDTLAIADGGLALGAGAGTAVTSTAAELNLLDTAVAGTVVASKAVIAGANKNLDTLAIADGGLKLGAGAGTAVTATAAQLNAHAAQSSGVAYETVAAAGSAQGDATAMSADFVLVSAADGAKGVKLPVPVAGRQLIVKNNVNAVLKVYPSTDGAINAIAANTEISMAALTSAVFVASSATQWFTVPLLPS